MKRKIFTKDFKKKLVAYGKSYYSTEVQKKVPNLLFEKCKEKGYEYLRCNTCEFRYDCNEGEESREENPNIVEDLIKEMIRCIENREDRLTQTHPKEKKNDN